MHNTAVVIGTIEQDIIRILFIEIVQFICLDIDLIYCNILIPERMIIWELIGLKS